MGRKVSQPKFGKDGGMSLLCCWVLADDGLYYQDPVLGGDGWFVCFDDDDLPELMLRHPLSAPVGSSCTRANVILAESGIAARLAVPHGRARRCFGPSFTEGEFEDAHAWFLNIRKPVPVSRIVRHRGCSQCPSSGVILRFGRKRG
jgi:hypothetical protein